MNKLSLKIQKVIQTRGCPIPFAEFMELALYDPQHGYYARPDQQIGRRGDFITSVSVGPFFGELLAFRFARWIEELHGSKPLQIVEAGAHNGQLAHDILSAVQQHESKLLGRIEYWIIEPSSAREAAQRELLKEFKAIRWATDFTEVGRVSGVIFSNELLDALPVHVFAWNKREHCWQERGVAVEDNRFVWSTLARPTLPAPKYPQDLLDVLPDGYIVETCQSADIWWETAARALETGYLLAIDYGGSFEELMSPARTTGTLRAYSKQRALSDVLENPGEQDITAHVNFTSLQAQGEKAGLQTVAFTNQSQFLTTVARDLWTKRGSWPQNQVRQFQTLTHPEHFGRTFRVLVQKRLPATN